MKRLGLITNVYLSGTIWRGSPETRDFASISRDIFLKKMEMLEWVTYGFGSHSVPHSSCIMPRFHA